MPAEKEPENLFGRHNTGGTDSLLDKKKKTSAIKFLILISLYIC